jgi:hypothetical protein
LIFERGKICMHWGRRAEPIEDEEEYENEDEDENARIRQGPRQRALAGGQATKVYER